MEVGKILQDKREEILQIAVCHGARNDRVFGSLARGEARPDSDVDILLQLDPGRSLLNLIAIKQDMEDRRGAMSPADEIDTTQFTVPEIEAAVEETPAVGKYVLAHLYSSSSTSHALQAGVRFLEHGNLMTAESDGLVREAGAYLVSTLTTYEMLAEEGRSMGFPRTASAKSTWRGNAASKPSS